VNRDMANDSAPPAWSDVMRGPVGGKLPGPPRLVHERRVQTWRARAYYDVLSADQKFRRDLEGLLEGWTWSAAQEFTRRWPLPERGLLDLAWTHALWRQGFLKQPRLQVGSRSYPGLEEGDDEAKARRLGYRPLPPRLKDSPSLRLGALRLYRRAVLQWPWDRIAAAETEDPQWPVKVKTVWDDVHRWAGALGVPIPQVARGRPPKSEKGGSPETFSSSETAIPGQTPNLLPGEAHLR